MPGIARGLIYDACQIARDTALGRKAQITPYH
jgi:hypothetical protein